MSSFVQSRRFTVCFAIFLLPPNLRPNQRRASKKKCLMIGTDQTQQTNSATSLRQHYLTPLNLIAAETVAALQCGQTTDGRPVTAIRRFRR
jgi:hypothetical protein